MTQTIVTLHHLDPGTLFRDRDALWLVCEDGDSDNIRATRIATLNVNNTGELMYQHPPSHVDSSRRVEKYNAYNEVVLVAGIYEVVSGGFRSPNLPKPYPENWPGE